MNKKQIEKIENLVREIIATNFPWWYVPRDVEYKTCNAIHYSGATKLWRDNYRAVISLSDKFSQEDGNTLVHELVHAFLPFKEMHGEKFQSVCRFIEGHTGYKPNIPVEPVPPKYIIRYYNRNTGAYIGYKALYRKVKIVKFLLSVDCLWRDSEYIVKLEVRK